MMSFFNTLYHKLKYIVVLYLWYIPYVSIISSKLVLLIELVVCV